MKVWFIALGSIVVGIAAALLCVRLEFAGVVEQFEPSNRPAQGPPGEAGAVRVAPCAAVVGDQDYDFGEGQRETSLTHEFSIKNEGQATLVLHKGATSCKCTLSELEPENLAPGEAATIKLQWKLVSTGSRFRQTAEIRTNDPERPTILFAVHGKVLDNARLEPTELVFSSLSSSEERKAPLRLYSYTATDLELVEHEFNAPESAPFFALTSRPLSADELAKEPNAKSGLALELTVKPGLPLGPVQQTIRLVTNLGESSTFDIPLSGSVISDISIVGPHDFDEDHHIWKAGSVVQSQGARVTLRVLVKGSFRRDVRLAVKAVDPAEVLSVSFGETTEINHGAVFMHPLTIEIRKDAHPVDRLGTEQSKLARVVLETTHPLTKTVNLYVKFSIK